MDLNKKLKELKPQQLNCNVFDVYSYNGLTMQDLLCQFFTTINECVKSTNEVIDLTDWLVSVGLEEEVVKKLMELIKDGTIENLINDNLFNNLNNKINEVATKGTTTEVLQSTTENYIKNKLDDGTIANLTIEDNSITSSKYKDNSVEKNKINSSFQNISNNFIITQNSMIDYTGQTVEHGGGDYLNFKTIKHYEFNKNKIKIKLNMSDYPCFKFMFYNDQKTFIQGSGKFYNDLSSLNEKSLPVSIIDNYLIIDFKKVKEVYPTAKYVSFTFKKDEVIEIYDITKKELEWLDISNNETIKDVYKTLRVNEFEKPFIIFSFDWYSNMYDKRYKILKGEYGYNATFCLDSQTSNYDLDSSLTRSQFNEMIENGWDYALYGGLGDRGVTEESWTNHIKGIVKQKENIGIFNPVMYNTPDNNTSDYISRAVKNNGFKMQRCNTNDNLLKNPKQFQTGAVFMCTGFKENCKNMIDKAIENNCGVVFYTHLVIEDSSNINDGADGIAGHCYESSFREILNYLKSKVDMGEIEVLTASEYYNKYNNIDSVNYDKNRELKRFNYLCNKLID